MLRFSHVLHIIGIGFCVASTPLLAEKATQFPERIVSDQVPTLTRFTILLSGDYIGCAERARQAKEYCLVEMGYPKEKCEAEYEQKLKQCDKTKS